MTLIRSLRYPGSPGVPGVPGTNYLLRRAVFHSACTVHGEWRDAAHSSNLQHPFSNKARPAGVRCVTRTPGPRRFLRAGGIYIDTGPVGIRSEIADFEPVRAQLAGSESGRKSSISSRFSGPASWVGIRPEIVDFEPDRRFRASTS